MSNNKINININEPKYDQNYYIGRFRHFLETTNPLNLFASKKTLETAKTLVTKYKNNEPLPPNTTEEELWRAKRIYDSAFHPDTGEKMLLIGRMSAQVPMNTLISAGMLTFYQNSLSVLFWQIINQSFNTIVNYTNRSGSEEVTNKDMLISYFSAVTSAVTVALSLNKVVAKFPPIISRCVPLAAVIFCNCLNTPLSRRSELIRGVPVFDSSNNHIGNSKTAAKRGIAMVVFSRNVAASAMVLNPIVMNHLEKIGWLQKNPKLDFPIQLLVSAVGLTVLTPITCAIFKQNSRISYDSLEKNIQEELKKRYGDNEPKYLTYNKGL